MTQRNARPRDDQSQEAGRDFQMAGEATATIPRSADLVLSRNARRIRVHHVLVRRRRWSKELDRLLSTVDPWAGWPS